MEFNAMRSRKVVAMIPARLGSKRIPKKNLRLLAGKPLIAYSIEAAKASGVFDEIYINSEADIFGEIARQYGVKFYKRPEALASDATINDEFLLDFMKNVSADFLVQLLPTSPLITPDEIKAFVGEMMEGGYDTLVSVANHQIASVYEGKPVNFNILEPHKSSQTMIPVQSYATVLMGWRCSNFLRNIEKHGGAYHGGEGKTGYFILKGLSTIDIDHEDDFALAEVAIHYKSNSEQYAKQYYESINEVKERHEMDVPSILVKDGIVCHDFSHENTPLVHIPDIIGSMDNSQSWCRRLVNTESNSATLISQLPGEGNRRHYHPNWNEWWYIVKGNWKWEIEDQTFMVKEGDFVFIPKNKRHRITAFGDKPAIRLAVSRGDVPHVYSEEL